MSCTARRPSDAPAAARFARRLRSASLLAVLLLLPTGFVACTSARPTPEELLSTSLTAFHSHLVFQRYDDAAAFLPPEQREPFRTYYEEQGEDLKFTEFEIRQLELCPDKSCAYVELDLGWYRLPSTSVQRSKMHERWDYAAEYERWTLEEQRVDEPAAKP